MTDYKAIAQDIIDNDYSTIGVRSLQNDETYEVGNYCRESYSWDVENDCSTFETTEEKACGTCATIIPFDTYDSEELAAVIEKRVKENASYRTGRQVIITGIPNTDGDFDVNEIRIEDAKVIAVL
jgi:hypothetical protein